MLLSVYLVILYLTVGGVRGVSKYLCYGPAGLSCTSHTLDCPDGNVISLQGAYLYTKGVSNSCTYGSEICDSNQSICCRHSSGDKKVTEGIDPDAIDSMYDNCTAKQSCTIHYYKYSQYPHHYIYYKYKCVQETRFLDFMCKDSVTTTYEAHMFYSGKQRSDNKAVNCSCDLSAPAAQVSAFVNYINLSPSSCTSFATALNKFKLNTCDAQGLNKIFSSVGLYTVPLTINIDKLVMHNKDYFWIYFQGQTVHDLTVTCTGCGVNAAGVCGITEQISSQCYGASSCAAHTITCKPGQLIAMTSNIYRGQKNGVTSCLSSTCNTDQSCCTLQSTDTIEKMTSNEIEEIYKSCNFKESCVFSPDYSNAGLNTFAYYKFNCIPATSVMNVMNLGSLSGSTEVVLSYHGNTRAASTSVDCSCDVLSSADTLTVTVYQLKLNPDSCCQVTITGGGISLIADCSEDGVSTIYTPGNVVSSPIKVTLDTMLARTEDVFIIRFQSGNGMDVSCGGCTEQFVIEDASSLCNYPTNDTTTEQIVTDQSVATSPDDGDNIVAIAAGTVGAIVFTGIIFFVIRKFKSRKIDPLNF